MFKLPEVFDKNEWFVTISLFYLIISFLIFPRVFPKGMIITILLFFAVMGLTADVLIAVDYPADFYTIMDSPKLEVFDAIAYFINYPLYGYFFSYMTYLIYKQRRSLKQLILFIILWSGLTAFIEWIAVEFNIFTYKHGWNTGYSFMVYLFVFTLSAVVVKLFLRLWESIERQSPNLAND